MYITRFAAAAACIGILAAAGSMYYTRNLKPYSTILISSDAKIRMEINQKGKVIKIKCDDKEMQKILKDYNGKGKDKLTAANEIIELEKEKGLLSSGDTVDIYVDSEKTDGYDTFKNDIEKGNSDLNVKVKGLDVPAPPVKEKEKEKATIIKPDLPKETKVPEPPAPEKEKVNTPEPPAPAVITPPAPAEPPAPKTEAPKAETPIPDKKVDPPAPPSEHEPPKAPEKPDGSAKPEIVRPDEPADQPKPPAPNEAEPLPHEPKKPLSVADDAINDIQKNKPLTMEAVHPAALHPAPEQEHAEAAPAPQPEEVHPQINAPAHQPLQTP